VAEKRIDAAILIIIVIVIAAAAAVGGYYFGARSGGGGGGASFRDDFNTLNQNIWFANFYDQASQQYSSSYGTAYVANGVLYVRPSYYRGVSTIQTRNQVVTTLPSTVKFRIRFEGNYYRFPSVALNSGFEKVLENNRRIIWYLGTTNHIFSPYGQYLEVYRLGNQVDSNKVFSVVPVDNWLEGEIRLYNDRVETIFNGVNLVLYSDVKSIVDSAGGLTLYFEAGDDYGQKGLDLDWVSAEAGTT